MLAKSNLIIESTEWHYYCYEQACRLLPDIQHIRAITGLINPNKSPSISQRKMKRTCDIQPNGWMEEHIDRPLYMRILQRLLVELYTKRFNAIIRLCKQVQNIEANKRQRSTTCSILVLNLIIVKSLIYLIVKSLRFLVALKKKLQFYCGNI